MLRVVKSIEPVIKESDFAYPVRLLLFASELIENDAK